MASQAKRRRSPGFHFDHCTDRPTYGFCFRPGRRVFHSRAISHVDDCTGMGGDIEQLLHISQWTESLAVLGRGKFIALAHYLALVNRLAAIELAISNISHYIKKIKQ